MRRISIALLVTSFSATLAQNGGFQYYSYEPETPPGMILIEGGSKALFEPDSSLHKLSVNCFFVSKYEETNMQYMEYLRYLKKYFSRAAWQTALPDTSVWLRAGLAPDNSRYLMENYLRHPAFSDFPVVGLSPRQIEKYAKWKTDRVNEMILIREGILAFDTVPTGDPGLDSVNLFSTDEYLYGKYPPPSSHPKLIPTPDGNGRRVRMEDGIFMPHYRLPLKEEWELAARAMGDSNNHYVITPKEYGHRRFDKKGFYDHFYVKERKYSKEIPWKQLGGIKKLKAVYDLEETKYGAFGLEGNVSELVILGKQYALAGGNWKTPAHGQHAEYLKAGSDSAYYKVKGPIPLASDSTLFCSAISGFRLVMTYTGPCDSKTRFKRSKRKLKQYAEKPRN